MARAVLCPVCGGSGKKYKNGTYKYGTEKPCHGCNGKGWVEVRTDYCPPKQDWRDKIDSGTSYQDSDTYTISS